jgi:hypothetical protein
MSTPMLEIVHGVTEMRHNRGTMMQSILAGAIFVALVLAPCVIAMLSRVDEPEGAAESNVFEEGFI